MLVALAVVAVLALVAVVAALLWAVWPYVLAAVAVAAVVLYVRRDDRRFRALATASTIDAMMTLSPEGFEQAVGRVLVSAGWSHVRHTGASGDLGADLLGRDPYGRRCVVQCKCFDPGHLVGSQVVQLVLGSAVIHGADKALIATSSGFTTSALELARAHGVELLDGHRLAAMAGGDHEALTVR